MISTDEGEDDQDKYTEGEYAPRKIHSIHIIVQWQQGYRNNVERIP